MARILVVDDEQSIRRTVQVFLQRDGHQVRTAADATLAEAELNTNQFEVIVADVLMPKMGGLELLSRAQRVNPDIEVVLITGQPNVATAVAALRQGAFDYLSKPFRSGRVCQVVDRAAKSSVLKAKNRRLVEENRRYTEGLEEIVRQRTAALRESEGRFRSVFEDGPLGMAIATSDLHFVNVNETFCRIVDRTRDELLATRPPDVFLPDEDTEMAYCQNHSSPLAVTSRFERALRRRDGALARLRVTVTPLRQQSSDWAHCLFMIEDITQRKQAAERLQTYQDELRDLAMRLACAEEQERRRIAVDLHDVAAQNLAVVMLKLREMQQRAAGTELETTTRDIHDLVEKTALDLRALSRNLSPPMLYELGLEAALETLARRFEEERHIVCGFRDDGQPKPLTEQSMTTAYRCMAELLANVARHAQATMADISISRDRDTMLVTLTDNGCGFELHPLQQAPVALAGFGLFSIRERMRALDGDFTLESSPGRGTKAALRLPLSSSEARELEAVR